MSALICQACSAELPNGARHCGSCGFRLGPLEPRALSHSERDRLAEDEFVEELRTLVGIAPPSQAPVEPERPRRRHRRFLLRVAITYASEHNIYTGATENISSGGLFVATDEPLVVGQRVEARFTLPGIEQPFTVPCVVRWLRAEGSPDGAPGMGLAFEDLEPAIELNIDSFLVHREPVLYPDDDD